MSVEVTAVVLGAALMHAVWNGLVKSSEDPLVELALLNLFAGLAALALLPVTGLPGLPSVPFLLGTMVFHAGYYAFLLLAYGSGGLSLVYPIARGASPLLIAVGSGALLDEPLGPAQLAGVFLLALAIASLALAGGLRALPGRAVLYSLATGATIAAYTMTDGTGARVARSPESYVTALFVLNSLPLLAVVRIARPGLSWARLAPRLGTSFLGGLLSIGSYGAAIWAMTRAPIALVAALRETSVVLAAVIGATFLGEPFGRQRMIASIGVAAGIVILRLAG